MRRRVSACLLVLCLAAPALAQLPPPKPPTEPAKPAAMPSSMPSMKDMDANRDGVVSLEEVMAYAHRKSSLAQPFRVVDVDADHDGIITQEELARAGIKGFEGMGAINVKELDLHGDGYVSREDLDEYFRRKHRQAFARADMNKDGVMRPSEFVLFRF